MFDYKRILAKEYPTIVDPKHKEAAYWKRYKPVGLFKEQFQIQSINFCPNEPYDYYVASGIRVKKYSGTSNQVIGAFTKIDRTVLCLGSRRDGQLLVCGDDSGKLKVFNTKNNEILRSSEAHKGPVRSSIFLQNQQTLSGSDDGTVKIWDVVSNTQLSVLNGHNDHVNAVAMSNSNPNLVFSGSSDHTVKLWDVRANMCTLTLKNKSPVKSILVFPGSGLLVSASGTEVNIWDIFFGERLLCNMDIHQKDITCLTFDCTGERILTGSLDHQVKVISTKEHSLIHSFKYSAPISHIAFSPNGSKLVTGMMNGLISIKHRMTSPNITPMPFFNQIENEQDYSLPTKNHLTDNNSPFKDNSHSLIRTQNEEINLLIEKERKIKLKPYDKMLKSYRYQDALETAFSKTYDDEVVLALFEELILRNALHSALRNKDEECLRKIIIFLSKQMRKYHFILLVIKIINIFLEVYSENISKYPSIREDLKKLEYSLSYSLYESKISIETLGCIDAVLAASKG